MTLDELRDGISALIARSNGSMDTKVDPGPMPTLEDVPVELRECLRARMELGRTNYGNFNQWKQRMSRPGYRKKRIRNMVNHLLNIVTENYEEDDLYGNIGGVLFGCMVLLEFHKVQAAQKVELDAAWAAQQEKFDELDKRQAEFDKRQEIGRPQVIPILHKQLDKELERIGMMDAIEKAALDEVSEELATSEMELTNHYLKGNYCDCTGVCVPFHIKLCPVCNLTVIRNMEA